MEIRQRRPQVWIIKCLKRETKLKDIIKSFLKWRKLEYVDQKTYPDEVIDFQG